MDERRLTHLPDLLNTISEGRAAAVDEGRVVEEDPALHALMKDMAGRDAVTRGASRPLSEYEPAARRIRAVVDTSRAETPLAAEQFRVALLWLVYNGHEAGWPEDARRAASELAGYVTDDPAVKIATATRSE